MQALKQNNDVTIKMGPFVSSADANIIQTGLTISQADIRLSKNGGNFAPRSFSGNASYDERGFYNIVLSASDTNTLGNLLVAIHEWPALPVWQYFMVMPENAYESLYGEDTLDVDINGQTVFASATNLDEVTAVTIGAVSAYNMYDVDVICISN